MGRDDLPTLGTAHPGLHLPADLAGQAVAIEQGRRDRGVAAIGRDRGPRGLAHQPGRRARGAERRDLVVAVEIFADAIAQRARILAEQLIEHGDVIRHQRLLVTLELRRNLGQHVRQVDLHRSNSPWRRRCGRAHALQRVGDAKRDILAPGRRDQLHADRHRLERHGNGHHRQADERDRLGVEADIGAHRQLDTVENEIHLSEFWRCAGRSRRDQKIDRIENLHEPGAIPAAEFLRAVDHRRRHHRARDQPVAHRGIEIVRALAQAVEMQRRAFGRGDNVGSRAGTRGFRDFDGAR